MPDIATPPAEVSWQLCVLTLLVMGLNSMCSPIGSILALNPRYRTYLVSSPFVNIADTMAILGALLSLTLKYTNLSLIEATRVLVLERLKTVEPNEGGVRSIETLTRFRWLIFALGPLPLAVRILWCCRGIPWTKALVGMFLAHFLILEMILFCAVSGDGPGESVPEMTEGEERIVDEAAEGRQTEHVVYRTYPYVGLVRNPETKTAVEILEVLHWVFVVVAFLVTPVLVLGWSAKISGRLYSESYGPNTLTEYFIAVVAFLIGPLGLAVHTIVLGLLHRFLKAIGEQYPEVGQEILICFVVSPSHRMIVVDETAIKSLLFFMYNLFTCIFGYMYWFDPKGTVDLGWRGFM